MLNEAPASTGLEETMNAEFTQIFELDVSEKLQLVEDLWDDLTATPEQIPVLET